MVSEQNTLHMSSLASTYDTPLTATHAQMIESRTAHRTLLPPQNTLHSNESQLPHTTHHSLQHTHK